jgi:chlorophyll/bacteriochlorophyll a synthase
MSQAANDWCDRHVDAINEPHRPIPSGRVPGRWGLWIALIWTACRSLVGAFLGPWGFAATVVAVIFAWIYSVEPIRLKRNGWYGNAAVGLCYEGLPWFTGAAVMLGAFPDWRIVVVALLYSLRRARHHDAQRLQGAGGRPEDGRRLAARPSRAGARGPPRLLGHGRAAGRRDRAARGLGRADARGHRAASLLAQGAAMRVLLRDPKAKAPWYNGTGVLLYVLGMLTAAFALSGLTQGGGA